MFATTMLRKELPAVIDQHNSIILTNELDRS